nr:hypothetical protein [Calditrichia bacterium]
MNKFFQRIIKYIISLFLMIYSLTFGLLTKKGRYIHVIICEYFGFAFLKPKLPVIPWEQIIRNQPVRLMDLQVNPGNMPVEELAVINALVLSEMPERIFEIGTMDGR